MKNHNDVLKKIADTIDISEHFQDLAITRYQSIGNWLDRDNSSIKKFNPDVSPQGSFLLGTVIRPIGDADEFDIDLVCSLNASKTGCSMAVLKNAVGNELKLYAKENNMKHEPDDGRRCWTMDYADDVKFHMDILPALPNQEAYKLLLEDSGFRDLANEESIKQHAIAITDKTLPQYNIISNDWPISNPKGYAAWFMSQQREVVYRNKQQVFESTTVYDSVEAVPDYKIKTPLQRSIQLLKRHRDTMFEGDEDKPISIIISTLAAHAYNGEETVDQALRTILKGMKQYIEIKEGQKWIANPVNPVENFADKWPENNQKERNFFDWLGQAQHDIGTYIVGAFDELPEALTERMSKTTVDKSLQDEELKTPAIAKSASAISSEADEIRSEGTGSKPWAS